MATASTLTTSKTRVRGVTRLTATFKTTDAGVLAKSKIGTAYGRVVAVEYDPATGSMDTGADLTFGDNVGAAFLTLTNAGTAAKRVRPTCVPVLADGTAVTPGAGYDGAKDVFVAGDVYLTVAQGGDAKTGTVHVIVAEVPPVVD